MLLWLYLVALGLAVTKFALAINGSYAHTTTVLVPSWSALSLLFAMLLPALLIVTGISATMTAHYLNQNSRSLIHRYNTQERRITAWFELLNSVHPSTDLETRVSDNTVKNEIRTLILQFEDLMIEELIDWIHISGYDVLEIAP